MISHFLKELKAQGLRQADIAERIGVTREFVSNLSRGANCSLDVAVRLADAFNVPMDKVVGRKSPEQNITPVEELLLKATAGDEDLARIALRSVEGEKLIKEVREERRVAAA